MSAALEFELNGRAVTYEGDAMARLLDVLRIEHRLTGTKEGCGEGECGSCTVLLEGRAVCSCLVPMAQCAGRSVRTVEDLAPEGELDALQRTLVEAGGVQCGACTPGIVVALHAALEERPQLAREDVRKALAGNLCRCTGYERILRAVESLVAGGEAR